MEEMMFRPVKMNEGAVVVLRWTDPKGREREEMLDRDEVVVFARGNAVYVTNLGIKNFHPIFHGFFRRKQTTIVGSVEDGLMFYTEGFLGILKEAEKRFKMYRRKLRDEDLAELGYTRVKISDGERYAMDIKNPVCILYLTHKDQWTPRVGSTALMYECVFASGIVVCEGASWYALVNPAPDADISAISR